VGGSVTGGSTVVQLLLFSLSSHLSERVQTHNSKKDKQNNIIETSTYVLDSIDIINQQG